MALAAWIDNVLLADLPSQRRWAYLCFTGCLFLALAGQQFIMALKVSVFMTVVGTAYEPVAKTLVLVVLVPVLFVYSTIFSLAPDPRMIVPIVCGLYAGVHILLALLIGVEDIPVWLAYVLYYVTETRSSIIMPMLWSVINDVTPPELARRVYPTIFFVVQLGGIVGATIAINVTSVGGEVGLMALQAAIFVTIAILSNFACRQLDQADDDGAHAGLVVAMESQRQQVHDFETPSGGSVQDDKLFERQCPLCHRFCQGLEGLWLVVGHRYAFMLFFVSYAYLVPRTILDYANSVLVVANFDDSRDQVAYFGYVNMWTNCGTALLALFGTRPIVSSLGVGRTLFILPVVVTFCVALLSLKYRMLNSAVCIVISSIAAYGLNAPCKEMLYTRTSKAIKYKAKSWSEMYGNPLMTVVGAQINLWVNQESPVCQPNCFRPLPTLILVGVWMVAWLFVASQIGQMHTTLEREGKVAC